MATIKELRALADDAIKRFDKMLPQLEINDSGAARLSASLALTVGEEFQAALHLIDAGVSVPAAGPIRTMIEATVDLILIARDPHFLWQLQADSAKLDIKLYTKLRDALPAEGAEDMIRSLNINIEAATVELAAATENAGKNGTQLKKRNVREDKLVAARNTNLSGAYALLCSIVHPNVTALNARHFPMHGEVKFRYKAPANPGFVESLLGAGIYTLTEAFFLMPSFSNAQEVVIKIAAGDIRHRHLKLGQVVL